MSKPVDLNQPNPMRLWDQDFEFMGMVRELVGKTVVDGPRLFILAQLARHVRALPGEVAEVGVYKGGSARMLAYLLSKKPVHLFDTFAGMPPTNPEQDHHAQGDFNDTSLEAVAAYLADRPNVMLHPGIFPASRPPGFEQTRFCFVHVDVDIYQSVVDCCDFFYPRMVPGGVIVFDDYGFITCPGAKVAVDRFFATTPEKPVYLPNGQAVVMKYT